MEIELFEKHVSGFTHWKQQKIKNVDYRKKHLMHIADLLEVEEELAPSEEPEENWPRPIFITRSYFGWLGDVLVLFYIIYAALMVRAGVIFSVTTLKPVNRKANTWEVCWGHAAKLSRTQRELMDLYGQNNKTE